MRCVPLMLLPFAVIPGSGVAVQKVSDAAAHFSVVGAAPAAATQHDQHPAREHADLARRTDQVLAPMPQSPNVPKGRVVRQSPEPAKPQLRSLLSLSQAAGMLTRNTSTPLRLAEKGPGFMKGLDPGLPGEGTKKKTHRIKPATKGRVIAIVLCLIVPVLVYFFVMRQVIQVSRLRNDGSKAETWLAPAKKKLGMAEPCQKTPAFPAPVEAIMEKSCSDISNEGSPYDISHQAKPRLEFPEEKAEDSATQKGIESASPRTRRPRRESTFRSLGQVLNRWVCRSPEMGRA